MANSVATYAKSLFLISFLASLPGEARIFPHFGRGSRNTESRREAAAENEDPKYPIGYYSAQNKKMGPCPPCANRNWRIPADFGLNKRYPNEYGPRKTYYIYNEDEAKLLDDEQRGLVGRIINPRRTAYSKPNNSNSTKAGWAAVNRVKESGGGTAGLTNLGKGTLDDPRTVAVSPALAASQEVCQGDMIFDCQYGWMRVEGGCTSGGLGNRIDVWEGTKSNLAVQAAWINQIVPMKVFPAGLIPRDFVKANMQPKQTKGAMPQSCF